VVKFIADSMLGKLARWLRILGVDTLYSENFTDDEIIAIAEREDRIILTCDHELASRARKCFLKVEFLNLTRLEELLAVLSLRYGFKLDFDPLRTRCPLCNYPLTLVRDPSSILTTWRPPIKAPIYWVCRRCGHVYWKGKHFIDINRRLTEAKRLLKLKE